MNQPYIYQAVNEIEQMRERIEDLTYTLNADIMRGNGKIDSANHDALSRMYLALHKLSIYTMVLKAKLLQLHFEEDNLKIGKL